MDERDVFILAEHALTSVIDQIKDDQWDMTVPTGMTRQPATLREAINYHAYDSASGGGAAECLAAGPSAGVVGAGSIQRIASA